MLETKKPNQTKQKKKDHEFDSKLKFLGVLFIP